MMEPTIHLRQAKAGDIPAILEIEQECFQEDSFSREQFVYLICRSKGTFYVVVEQERVIAYVSLLFHAGTRYLRIYSIAVSSFLPDRLVSLPVKRPYAITL